MFAIAKNIFCPVLSKTKKILIRESELKLRRLSDTVKKDDDTQCPAVQFTRCLSDKGKKDDCNPCPPVQWSCECPCPSPDDGDSSKKMKPNLIPCTLIPGDGVGPLLADVVKEVFRGANVPVKFETLNLSDVKPDKNATLDHVVESVNRNKVCIKGILQSPETPHEPGVPELKVVLRRELDLFAHVVHVKTLPSIQNKHGPLDFYVIREQTEGEYMAHEHESVKGVIECLKIVTSRKSERIAKFAFDFAVKRHRKKVTCVHKANIMKIADGLFMNSAKEMSKLYPRIEHDAMIVDNCTMQLVSKPKQFDILLTPNLYGGIVGATGCGLVGGSGMTTSVSYSEHCALFQQGTRSDFYLEPGRTDANPIGLLLSACKMLDHVNLYTHAEKIRNAIYKVLEDGKVRTPDIGGKSTTDQVMKAILDNIKA